MTQPVLYKHVNNRKARVQYTIAYNFTKEGDTLNINYGIAQVHRGIDTFTREEGRRIATDRLNKITSGKSNLRYGSFKVQDAEGINVSREIERHFETARSAHLSDLDKLYFF